MSEGLLSEDEVRSYLGVEASEIEQLMRRGKLTAYRVGGAYRRYRKDEVVALKNGRKFQMPDQFDKNWWDVVRDFIGFHGAYILLSIVVVLLFVYFLRP